MRKFLVVGCGGSGGATLSYMMDQLRSELALKGVDRIPDGWQFIHLDVPVGSRSEAPGLGSVRDLGGTYYGTGVSGVSYSVLDNGVSQALRQNNGLSSIATWAPRTPEEVIVAIGDGAGQYRSIGRMITLSKPAGIRQALEGSWNKLSRVETNSEMTDLARRIPALGSFDPEEPPIVLVASSMAGGAGASMAIDVCRLLTLIPNLDPSLMGVFMVSADLFDSLPPAARTGVRANALAMLGEIVATQSGAARQHDVGTLSALGHQNGDGARVPFQRVFPVGRFVGAQRTQFGDGSAQAVYRGLGRGLAGMIASGTATAQFVAYDLVNTLSPSADRDYLGWGVEWDPLPWGSFGFASLSMGRERYREYAAQRLARTSVDRLLTGHMQDGSSASSNQQIDALLTSQWARICHDLALPVELGTPISGQALLDWFLGTAFPRDQVDGTARGLVESQLAAYIPSPGGVPAAQWLPTLKARLRDRKAAMAAGISQASHQWAYDWQLGLVQRIGAVTENSIATFGVSFILIQSVRLIFGNNKAVNNPAWLQGGWEIATDVIFPYNRMFIIVFCAVTVTGMYLLITRSRLGLLLRATTQNRTMAASPIPADADAHADAGAGGHSRSRGDAMRSATEFALLSFRRCHAFCMRLRRPGHDRFPYLRRPPARCTQQFGSLCR